MPTSVVACPHCKRECPPGTNFCPACGAKLQPVSGAIGRMIEDYRKQLADTPDDAAAHYNLALAYLQARDEAAAEVHLRQVVELEPRFADAYVALARISLHRGEAQQAAECVSKALRLDPASPSAKRLAAELDALAR